MDVEGVGHRMVGVHFVDEADLHLVADPERPVDLSVLGAGFAVDELPAHVRRRRHAVDLDHVVFPLDSLRRVVCVASAVVSVVLVMLVVLGVVLLVLPWAVSEAEASSGAATAPLPVARKVMPHFGQDAGELAVISGCIGQTKAVGASALARA